VAGLSPRPWGRGEPRLWPSPTRWCAPRSTTTWGRPGARACTCARRLRLTCRRWSTARPRRGVATTPWPRSWRAPPRGSPRRARGLRRLRICSPPRVWRRRRGGVTSTCWPAQVLLVAGQAGELAALQPQLEDLPSSPRRGFVIGHLALLAGDPAAEQIMVGAWERCDPAEAPGAGCDHCRSARTAGDQPRRRRIGGALGTPRARGGRRRRHGRRHRPRACCWWAWPCSGAPARVWSCHATCPRT